MLGDQVTQNPVVVGDIYIHLYCGQYALMSETRPGEVLGPKQMHESRYCSEAILIKDKIKSSKIFF